MVWGLDRHLSTSILSGPMTSLCQGLLEPVVTDGGQIAWVYPLELAAASVGRPAGCNNGLGMA
jgi:hypothetical protein